MAKFNIKMANLNIEINSLYDKAAEQCSSYLCEDNEKDFSIFISQEDITFESKKNDIKIEELNKIEVAEYLETLAVYRKIAEKVLDYNTFLMHGAVIASEDEAYMITAKSGIGKTTRVKMWLNRISDFYVVNGDKPLIKIEEDQVLACGTPWCGKENLGTNTIVPLKAIFFLERAEENEVKEISFSEALENLLQQTYKPVSNANLLKTLGLLKQLNGKVRFFTFKSNLDEECVKMAYDAVSNNRVAKGHI